MSYGRTFPLWRAAAGDTWHDYTRHAFVEGMRDGSLPRDAFLHYLVQDYVFLVHFSRAWALAVTKAETLDEMRACAATVHALLDEEMRLHVQTCAAEGISEEALFSAEEAPQNLAYTRYVLDAGHSGDFLDLLAALAPCVLGYGEIGARLGQEAGAVLEPGAAGAPPLPSEAELVAMKMPALRAFVKAHCAGAVSLALGGEQRRTKADVVRELRAWLASRRDPA